MTVSAALSQDLTSDNQYTSPSDEAELQRLSAMQGLGEVLYDETTELADTLGELGVIPRGNNYGG